MLRRRKRGGPTEGAAAETATGFQRKGNQVGGSHSQQGAPYRKTNWLRKEYQIDKAPGWFGGFAWPWSAAPDFNFSIAPSTAPSRSDQLLRTGFVVLSNASSKRLRPQTAEPAGQSAGSLEITRLKVPRVRGCISLLPIWSGFKQRVILAVPTRALAPRPFLRRHPLACAKLGPWDECPHRGAASHHV